MGTPASDERIKPEQVKAIIAAEDRRKRLLVINRVDAPASERDLVAAAISFANGAWLRLEETPSILPRVDSHGRLILDVWDRHSELLSIHRASRDLGFPMMEDDETMLAALVLFEHQLRSKALNTFREIALGRGRLVRDPVIPDGPHERLMNPNDDGSELAHGVTVTPVVVPSPNGPSLRYFHKFSDIQTLVSYAALLVLDQTRPYGRDLCVCKLRSCGKLFMLKRPHSGRPRRDYCSDAHMERAHNLARPLRGRSKARKPK